MFKIAENDVEKIIHELINIFTVLKVSAELHEKKMKKAEKRLIDLRQDFLASLEVDNGREEKK